MPKIHPMAVVEPGAQLAEDVVVGPFAYIGPNVRLGPGCVVHHHASLINHVHAGEANHFHPNCVIGGLPQDLKYRGGDCRVTIGSHNHFRECSTVHIGTEDGGGYTAVGSHGLFMVGSHIAHDCVLGDHVILANNVLLAGHVEVQDYVVISGAAGSHHFVRFGKHCFIGGLSGITRDVPPFMIADGHPGTVRGVNVNGLRRRGFSETQIDNLKTAYRMLYRDNGTMAAGVAELQKLFPNAPEITDLLTFLRESTTGKHGRYRENFRGKPQREEEDPGTVSGN